MMDEPEERNPIEVWLKETSQPIIYPYVVNAYQKGDFYCIYDGLKVYKYPIANIWRVVEIYGN